MKPFTVVFLALYLILASAADAEPAGTSTSSHRQSLIEFVHKLDDPANITGEGVANIADLAGDVEKAKAAARDRASQALAQAMDELAKKKHLSFWEKLPSPDANDVTKSASVVLYEFPDLPQTGSITVLAVSPKPPALAGEDRPSQPKYGLAIG